MAEMKVQVTKYRCDRCSHEWIPRQKDRPTICPKCKSPYWNKPRKRNKKNKKQNGKI